MFVGCIQGKSSGVSSFTHAQPVRKMVEHAFQWAETNGKIRTNVQHGELEAKLIIDDTFSFTDKKGEGTDQEKSLLVEDYMVIRRVFVYVFLASVFGRIFNLLTHLLSRGRRRRVL